MEEPLRKGKIIIEIETGWVGIDEQGHIVEDNAELGEDLLRKGVGQDLKSIDDEMEIAFSQEGQHQSTDKKDRAHHISEWLLLLQTQIEALKEIELIEADEERKDCGILLGGNTQEITQC
jgi:hypothetical protein